MGEGRERTPACYSCCSSATAIGGKLAPVLESQDVPCIAAFPRLPQGVDDGVTLNVIVTNLFLVMGEAAAREAEQSQGLHRRRTQHALWCHSRAQL